ncbi:unnamed protein product, partial [Symbiodinium sp. KB8]
MVSPLKGSESEGATRRQAATNFDFLVSRAKVIEGSDSRAMPRHPDDKLKA